MSDLKVIIVDDDPKTRDLIESFLPNYASGIKTGFGDSAINTVKPDSNGKVADLLVINGEDRKGMSLYLFDWVRNKSLIEEVQQMPVIILIDDEFSDKALDFLEIGDAVFYEGELEENQLFSVINEALEQNEFSVEPFEPSFSDEKNFDRISGISVKIKGENSDKDKKRSVVLDMDKQLDNLQAALERGKKKSERIKELLESASEYKEHRNKEKEEKRDTRPTFLNKIRVEKGLEPVGDLSSNYEEDDIPEEFRIHHNIANGASNIKEDIKSKVSSLNDKIRSNPFAAGAATGMFGQNSTNNMQLNGRQSGLSNSGFLDKAIPGNMVNQGMKATSNSNKKTIVIVDDEERERKACEIFLGQKYNVVQIESGRGAIDYFVRNTADLLLIDTYMPHLGGVQTFNSVRWQPNGKNVPVIYLFDPKCPVAVESLKGEGVLGIMKKPLTAGNLAMAVDGYFRKKR